MLKPQRLRAGDLIAIAAPGSPIREEFLERGVAEIESMGFRCRYDQTIFSRYRYLAGSDERRADELLTYLAEPEVKAILFARGGFGTARILNRLPSSVFDRPKILCGYSDLTALHLCVHAEANWVTFYGPMAAWELGRGDQSYDKASFLSAISGEVQVFSNLRVIRRRPAVRGLLLGGCLSLLQSAIGTPLMPNLSGSILLLEDEGVKPYQLDRMLLHLRQSGSLEGVRGIVFGEMPGCMQVDHQGYEIADVIEDITPAGIPVAMNLPAGHAVRVATIPLGIEAELDSASNTLRLLEAAVT